MTKEDKNELELEKEEKDFLLEYMKMQNEALKRIYQQTVNKEKEDS